MAYTSILPGYTAANAPKAVSTPRRGFFTRVLDTIVQARLRQAEREIAVYLADTGGKFTDEAEREIARRFTTNFRGW